MSNTSDNTIETLTKEVDDLLKDGKHLDHLNIGSLMPLAAKYLTSDALTALSNRSLHQMVTESGQTFVTAYFAIQAKDNEVEHAVKLLSDIANELASENLIHSALAEISSITLGKQPLMAPKQAVFMFVLVPSDKLAEIKERYEYSVEEGEVGKHLSNPSMTINEGEAVASFYATNALTMIVGFDLEGLIKETVRTYLALLPKGTTYIGATPCTITDLSIPYELRFAHPLFTEIKSFELIFTRNIVKVDGRIQEYRLFHGIRYYDQEGYQLYQDLV